jgi:hypothetical protein
MQMRLARGFAIDRLKARKLLKSALRRCACGGECGLNDL